MTDRQQAEFLWPRRASSLGLGLVASSRLLVARGATFRPDCASLRKALVGVLEWGADMGVGDNHGKAAPDGTAQDKHRRQ